MNIMELGAIGELVGGAAVIASLIFVGLQVRSQARESRLSSTHALTLAYATYLDSLIESRELREVYLSGLVDFDALEGEQRLLFSASWGKIIRFHESAFYQHRGGRIDDVTWAAFDGPQAELMGYPGVQAWWRSRAHWHSGPFGEHIQSLIDRAGEPSAYPLRPGAPPEGV